MTKNKTIEFIRKYVEKYNQQVIEEEGHNKFDDFSETNKASISALNILLFRLAERERELT